MLAEGICCCPDTCKEEISFLKSFAATRNQLINPSVNRPSRKSMNDDSVVPGTVHIYHYCFRNSLRVRGADLLCCGTVQR